MLLRGTLSLKRLGGGWPEEFTALHTSPVGDPSGVKYDLSKVSAFQPRIE